MKKNFRTGYTALLAAVLTAAALSACGAKTESAPETLPALQETAEMTTLDVETPETSDVSEVPEAATFVLQSDGTVKDMDISIGYRYFDCEGKYSGEVDEYGLPSGKGEYVGTLTDSDGISGVIKYTGGFKDGNLNGQGHTEVEFDNGTKEVYDYNYVNGFPDGHGSQTFTHQVGELLKEHYEGEMVMGVFEGEYTSTRTYADGSVREFECTELDGKANGPGKMKWTYTQGEFTETTYEGTWVDNELTGEGTKTMTYSDGYYKVCVGNFENSQLNGYAKVTSTSPEGIVKVYEGMYKDGDLDSGMETDYDAAGNVTAVKTWENGQVTG